MQLVICAKSPWLPRIRREHEIARSAAADGHEVVFVERAHDLRALTGSAAERRAWLRPAVLELQPRLRVIGRSTLLPGHRSEIAQRLDARGLARTLRSLPGIGRSTVVATQPWQWPAVAVSPAARRVFDCADDWRSLIPRRASAIGTLHRAIGAQADAVILVSQALADAFPPHKTTVVPNGAAGALIDAELMPLPDAKLMIYTGTLSERFDAPLLGAVLDQLPDWSVELYGQCQYAGHASGPAHELRALLRCERVRWHTPVERAELAGVLDRARVLIAPHRGEQIRGQDSMKLYDYAARARPVVCTPGALGPPERVAAAGAVEAANAAQFARAVTRAAPANTDWARENTWDSRWPAWAEAALCA